jgi:hypothetical protein
VFEVFCQSEAIGPGRQSSYYVSRHILFYFEHGSAANMAANDLGAIMRRNTPLALDLMFQAGKLWAAILRKFMCPSDAVIAMRKQGDCCNKHADSIYINQFPLR